MWLKDFFENAFAAVGPLGLAGFAMLIIVALVAIIAAAVGASKRIVGFIGALALVSVVGMAVFNQVYPTTGFARPIPAGLRDRYPAFPDKLDCLDLELSAEPSSLHDPPPAS